MNELVRKQTKTGLAISTETKELIQASITIAHWNDIGGYQSR